MHSTTQPIKDKETSLAGWGGHGKVVWVPHQPTPTASKSCQDKAIICFLEAKSGEGTSHPADRAPDYVKKRHNGIEANKWQRRIIKKSVAVY